MEQRGSPGPPSQAPEVPQEPTQPCVRRWAMGRLEEGPPLCSRGPGFILPGDCGWPTGLPLGVLSPPACHPISFYRTLTLTWAPCPGAESSLPDHNSELQAEAGILFVSEPLQPCTPVCG